MRGLHSRALALGALILCTGTQPAPAQNGAVPPPESTRSVRQGVYSTEQADRGERTFREVCAACHATGEFTRPGFFATWRGGPIAGLFDLIRTTMPQDDPGALPPASYADVLAYLLRLNGFPAGTRDLPAEAGGLGAILVDPPDRGPQTSPSRSTRNGVYAAAQAALGQERYALQCQSCHTPASHTGPTFVNAWRGRPLWDLLEFIRWNMPQGEPGVLTAEECAQLVAYLLQMNGLPPGPAELPTDSITLSAIRFDPVSPPPGGTGTR